jgi:hypothetical protein
MVICQTCRGSYEPTQRDGTQYFHACPPLTFAELRDALDAGTVQLAPHDAAQLKLAQAADARNPLAGGSLSRADALLASLGVPRPNARDENLVSTREKDKGAMKAEGAGVVPV